jgi:glycosyltransferase involved in cell wall biosynthesis
MISSRKLDESIKVSVVLSVYNFKAYPVRGIETILEQSYSDFEFIIMDDGSDQQTKKILNKYAKSDSRIILLVNDSNLKLASSLNRGIREARGEYIVRADANIDYRRDRIEKQVEFMEGHPDVDVLGSNFFWSIEGQNERKLILLPESHPLIARSLSRSNCICHPSVLYRKERLIPYGPYKDGFGKGQDYYLWMKTRKKLTFHNLQEPLLVKWHRANPWEDKLWEYFINNIRSRIVGMKTSYNPLIDLLNFPRAIQPILQI